MARQPYKPRAILLSKRAHIVYVERARVMVKDDRVVWLTDSGEEVEKFFNIPYRNTALLLLGKGTSITDAAMRKLADAQVVVGFSGSGGAPLTHAGDAVFSAGVSEYRPTEYMQAWMRMWLDEERRLDVAKLFQRQRMQFIRQAWGASPELKAASIQAPEKALQRFADAVEIARTTTDLLSAEAVFAKELYATLGNGFRIEFRREEAKRSQEGVIDTANGMLDHGNYIAYGFAAVSLHALGISFALPVLHGKTRRGALVFDVADLIKDALVMPLAFHCAVKGLKDQDFRAKLIDRCHEADAIDSMITTIQISLQNKNK